MINRKIFAVAVLLVLAVVSVFLIRGWYIRRSTFVLGVIGNFKGKNAQVGVESFNAITLAYEEYKKKYPHGISLKILPVDDSWAVEKMKETYLSTADKVDMLIILSGSTNVLTIEDDIKTRPGLVHALVGPSTTRFSAKMDNIIRNIPDLEQEQKQIASFLQGYFKAGKILLLVESEYNYNYTEPSAEFFTKYADKIAVEKVAYSGTSAGTGAAMELLKTNEYDAVYILAGGLPRETGILIQHIRAIKPGIPVMITPWTRGKIFLQALGSQNGGIFMASHVKFTDNPLHGKFIASYRARFGEDTHEYFVPIMYDLANSLLVTLHTTRSVKASVFIPELLKKEYQGTMGVTRFDEFGDAAGTIFFYKLVNGDWQYIYP